jgi:uncharacterized protein (DUF1697 family)
VRGETSRLSGGDGQQNNMTYVVFLRGVNVGGHRTFRPSLLAEQMKAYDVVNIGAAGTFVVRKPISPPRLRAEMTSRLPFDAKVMICKAQELISLALNDPFAGELSDRDLVHFICLFEDQPRVLPTMPIRLPAEGDWIVRILGKRDRFLIGVYRRHMKAISLLNSIDKIFGASATTRNWNTITQIITVLENKESQLQ